MKGTNVELGVTPGFAQSDIAIDVPFPKSGIENFSTVGIAESHRIFETRARQPVKSLQISGIHNGIANQAIVGLVVAEPFTNHRSLAHRIRSQEIQDPA